MDFITKLPRTNKQHDSIMVVLDKHTKDANFIPVKLTHKEANIVDVYMRQFCLTEFQNLPQNFGRDYLMDLELI
jgi:hypothetical protein